MSLARVQFFSISLDGFGTGEGLSLDDPFGHAGERLHEWMFVTRWWREMVGEPGGSGGIDDAFLRLHDPRDRRRADGCREVRSARMARGPGMEGLVGSQPAVPHTSLRPHPLPAPVDRDGRRDDIPFHRRVACRSARDGARGGRRPGCTHRRRSHRDPRVPYRRARRPHAHRGGPDLARPRCIASGTDWRASRRTTRSRPPPRQAASRT